jgi:hypothetical protein
MPVLEATKSVVEETPSDLVDDQVPATTYGTDRVGDQLPVPPDVSHSRGGTTEIFQHCLDLLVTGNRTADKTMRKFVATVDKVAPLDAVGPARQLELIAAALEMTQRLAHAPFDLGRGLVQSAVVVDVDVDVDIASRQGALQESNQEERR